MARARASDAVAAFRTEPSPDGDRSRTESLRRALRHYTKVEFRRILERCKLSMRNDRRSAGGCASMRPSLPFHANIVIVDDDASVCRAIERLVRSAGMSAATFPSGEAYLACLNAAKLLESDCAVIDAQMPGMSGLDVQEHLIRVGRAIPIVFITAHDSADVRDQALSRGAVAFLRKPVRRELLLHTIGAALQLRRAAKEGGP